MFKFGSKKDLSLDYKCTIRLLDDSEVLQCDFQPHHKGQYLLDYVCSELNIIEKDYFGLRFVDNHKQRHWLDLTKSAIKQVKGMNPIVFCFRVKFYPQDPFRLKEEITRYQIFLQLRRDLLHGRLYCSQADAALLAAYVIQSEVGDYDPEEHGTNYVAEFKLLLKQTPRMEEKIMEIHQGQLKGQVPSVAEMNFLRKACLLETYGVDPHPVKDHKGNQLYLGINYAGILTFQGSRKTHHFKWSDIQKINYEGKMFIIHLMFSEDAKTKKKHLIGFKCPTQSSCHHLWRCAVEQRYFYNMNSSSEVPSVTTGGGLFSRGSKFRYSGRVEKEVMDDMKNIKRDPPQFQRSFTRPASFRHKSSTASSPDSPTTPPSESEECYPPLRYVNHSTPVAPGRTPSLDHSDMFVNDDSLLNSSTHRNFSLDHEMLEPLSENAERPPNAIDSLASNMTPPLDISPTKRSPLFMDNHVSLEPVKVDHSPSESRTVTPNGKISSGVLPPPPPSPLDVKLPKRRVVKVPASRMLSHHISVVRVIVVACLFILLLLSCLLIVIMESDSSLFSDVRKFPEMVFLRREYYEPAKDYLVDWLNVLFKR